MTAFTFYVLDGNELKPASSEEWLRFWSAKSQWLDDREHADLMAKHRVFAASDFERIGKWKDSVRSPGQWKPNVAMVAYPAWMKLAHDRPALPASERAGEFLDYWSGWKYTDIYPSRTVTKVFGLSRATTVLHFLSGGSYPIFDSRVRDAMGWLCDRTIRDDVFSYLNYCCPYFKELAVLCKTENNLRILDQALFQYGAWWRTNVKIKGRR